VKVLQKKFFLFTPAAQVYPHQTPGYSLQFLWSSTI